MARTEDQSHKANWRGWHRDTLWQISERGARALLGFAVSVAIARRLGPDGFGLYSYALATVALFAFLAQAGLDALLIREFVRAPQRAASLLSEGLCLRFAGAVCAGIASFAALWLAAPGNVHGAMPLVVILAIAGILQSGWVVESWLLANRCFADVSRAKIIAYVASAALRLGCLLLTEPLVPLAAISLIESSLAAFLLWRASRKHLNLGLNSLSLPDRRHASLLARLAAPMLLSAFTIAIYSRIDVFMLGRILGQKAVGLYSAATMLSEGFYLVPAAMMAAAAPRLAGIYLHDRTAFEASVYRLLRILSISGILVAACTTIAAPHVIPFLFGTSYAPAVKVLQIHIWSTWAVYLSSASDPWYINHDFRRFYLIKTSLAAIFNVLLNISLIPRFGINGAAWATVISYIASAFLVGACFADTRPIFIMQLRSTLGFQNSCSTRRNP